MRLLASAAEASRRGVVAAACAAEIAQYGGAAVAPELARERVRHERRRWTEPMGVSNAPAFRRAGRRGTLVFHKIVTSVACLQAVQSDLGVGLNGSTVQSWADQSGNGFHYSQGTPARQPTYNPAGLNGRPTIFCDGTDDALTSALDLASPPVFIWGIARLTGTQAAAQVWLSDAAGTGCVIYVPAGGGASTQQFNGANANLNAGTVVGTWVRFEAYFANGVADYTKFGATVIGNPAVPATAGNNNPGGARNLGAQTAAGGAPSKTEWAVCLHYAGKPNAGELAGLTAAATSVFGASVVV